MREGHMIPAQLKQLHNEHWQLFAHGYDLTEQSGCGEYTEHWVSYAQSFGWDKVGHLKKHGSQTQYNGHAIDAFLYADGDGNPNELFQSVDIIANAESKPPYSDSHRPPSIGWNVDIPRYTISDWMKEPNQEPGPVPNTVPWVGYNEQQFQFLKRQLAYDYARRPQGVDFDVIVWAARTFHNAYMGPEGKPLGEDAGLQRAQKEWCAALGVPVKDVPIDWNVGDPV